MPDLQRLIHKFPCSHLARILLERIPCFQPLVNLKTDLFIYLHLTYPRLLLLHFLHLFIRSQFEKHQDHAHYEISRSGYSAIFYFQRLGTMGGLQLDLEELFSFASCIIFFFGGPPVRIFLYIFSCFIIYYFCCQYRKNMSASRKSQDEYSLCKYNSLCL